MFRYYIILTLSVFWGTQVLGMRISKIQNVPSRISVKKEFASYPAQDKYQMMQQDEERKKESTFFIRSFDAPSDEEMSPDHDVSGADICIRKEKKSRVPFFSRIIVDPDSPSDEGVSSDDDWDDDNENSDDSSE